MSDLLFWHFFITSLVTIHFLIEESFKGFQLLRVFKKWFYYFPIFDFFA